VTPRAAAVTAVVALGAILGVATAHEVRVGARSVAASDAATGRGDLAAAIAEARTAAEALAPASPYPARGYARLDAIGRDAESHGDLATANAAWTAMLAAAAETRAPLTDTARWRDAASQGLARVAAAPSRAGGLRDAAPDAGSRLALDLERDDTPETATFALLGAGTLLFFGGVAWLLLRVPGRWSAIRVPALCAVSGALLAVLACTR